MRRLLMSIGFVTAAAFSNPAIAQAPPSGGESSFVLSCFYECKEGPVVRGIPTFQEITTLIITNESPFFPVGAVVGFLDANERVLAHSFLDLSEEDLDEINVCHTLFLSGIVPPPVGKIDIVTVPVGPLPGTYAWVKNLLGKFFSNNPEPFQGRVTGIAKTECRVVPEEVAPFSVVRDKVLNSPEIPPILVERTDP